MSDFLKSPSVLGLVRKAETPFYLYDGGGLSKRVEFFKKQLPKNARAFFAMKANHQEDVLKLMREQGLGLDVVSLGELRRGLDLGFHPKDILFSGVGKSTVEIEQAIDLQIQQINVESLPELSRILDVAKRLGKAARVALRVNPDVNAETHPYIRTGFRENKFGIDFDDVPACLELVRNSEGFLELTGLTLHIGSQIQDQRPFREAILKAKDLYLRIQREGFHINTLDVGGGLGIDYKSGDLKADEKAILDYGRMISETLSGPEIDRIYLEPGRILVARFGYLVGQVQYVKRTPHKSFLVLNTGMHHLIRPALYDAYHRIELLNEKPGDAEVFDVVGPICESSDTLGFERVFPKTVTEGDLVVVKDTGAYGSVMSSDYNLHARPKEYFL